MKQEIEAAISTLVKDVFGQTIDIELTRPDEQFGDYATNVALKLASQLNQKPRDIAEKLAKAITDKVKTVQTAGVAGPGFLNLTVTDKVLWELVNAVPAQPLKGKTIVAEYSDPNPFKVLHVGHLYTSVVGDAIASLLQIAGARVHKVNYGGDVGLHVGKTMWAILEKLGGEHPEKLKMITHDERAEWLTNAYVVGSTAYEDDESAKQKIVDLNKKIYQIHAVNDRDSALAQIYWTARTWSYQYFEEFYKQIGTSFEKYYPESVTVELGLQTVKEHIGDVFEESQGAIVFKGEKYGLHTRVFVTRENLPSYEAKEIGLSMKKWQDYHFDQSVIITGNEQAQYMSVVLKAIEQFMPELAKDTTHLTHGMVKLAGGTKMSSRKGNILRAVEVLEAVSGAVEAQHQKNNHDVTLGAVKYAFLKQRLGGDIVFDIEESVAVEGHSGPYLQYAYARAQSILAKAGSSQSKPNPVVEQSERSLLRKLSEYTEVVNKAVEELMPHHVATYLYELAQTFNRFYEQNRVIGDKRQDERVELITTYANTLRDGLALLNIPTPEKM